MRPPRRHRVLAVALRQWRNAAKALALLALLANAALLPALHVGTGGAALPAHNAEASHRHVHDDGDRNEPASPSHQVCHFCRLLGVALPPPPTIVIAIVSAWETAVWSVTEPILLRQEPLRTANLPRAPPLRA